MLMLIQIFALHLYILIAIFQKYEFNAPFLALINHACHSSMLPRQSHRGRADGTDLSVPQGILACFLFIFWLFFISLLNLFLICFGVRCLCRFLVLLQFLFGNDNFGLIPEEEDNFSFSTHLT